MRKNTKRAALATVLALTFAGRAWAQNDDASSAAGCFACSGCGGFLIILWLGIVALQIALLVWVARDAKARGMDSAVLWMLLVLFFPLIGILVYIFSRPQGNLLPCPNCGNKRLQASVRCPHCGFGV